MNIRQDKLSSILVTGGTGFLGSYVIRDLVREGYSVHAIRRNKATPSYIQEDIWKQVQWIDCDLFDTVGLAEAMDGIDAVIHCAARVSFQKKNRKELLQTNIEGTANVVNAAIEKNIGRFVHVSSVAALGRKKDQGVVSELQKWEADASNTTYAVSKYYGEMEVWRAMGEGLNAVIVNPSTILGYGNWNLSSCALFKNIYEGFPWYTKGMNGFVDVEDVSRVIIALMNSDISSERFIVNGENWNFKLLLDTIAQGFEKKAPQREATSLLSSLAWRWEWIKSIFTGKDPLLTKESAAVAQSHTQFNNAKLLKALPGFEYTPLQTTIGRACRQYIKTLS